MNNNQYKIQKADKVKPYIIKEDTMIILPWFSSNAYLNSTVLEEYQEKDVSNSPLAIVEESCDYYGSDLSGRLNSAATILKGQRMLPVIISETNRICMVPLCSPYKPECVWLSYKHVLDYIPKGAQTVVILSNYQKIELNITRDALDARLSKAARVISTHKFRQEQISDLYRMQAIAEEASLYPLKKDTFDDQFEQ